MAAADNSEMNGGDVSHHDSSAESGRVGVCVNSGSSGRKGWAGVLSFAACCRQGFMQTAPALNWPEI